MQKFIFKRCPTSLLELEKLNMMSILQTTCFAKQNRLLLYPSQKWSDPTQIFFPILRITPIKREPSNQSFFKSICLQQSSNCLIPVQIHNEQIQLMKTVDTPLYFAVSYPSSSVPNMHPGIRIVSKWRESCWIQKRKLSKSCARDKK